MSERHVNMLNNLPPEYSKIPGEPIWDITKSVAIEMDEQDKEITHISNKLNIENLHGDELEQRINELTGLERKQATYGSTSVFITGTAGTEIYKGDIVASDTVSFIIKENVTIDDTGQASVLVVCEKAGAVGNVPVGAIKYFPISIAGLNTVMNPNYIENGYNAESDKDLLARYYEHIRTPATSGNKAHYRNWAKEVTGVGNARVIPLWDGDNTVKVIIIDSNKTGASPELIAKVQKHIDPDASGQGDGKAPIGAKCTVVSAIEVPVNISFTAVKDPSVTDQERLQNVTDRLTAYLREIAFNNDTVMINQIHNEIFNSKGVMDYSNLTVNGMTSNISIAKEEIAVIGGVTIA